VEPAVVLSVAPHPRLALGAFEATLPTALGELPSPPWLVAGLSLDAEAPLARDEEVRTEVRELLRVGGYKPTGRGKPASEYLVRAASEGALGSINAVVDACNVVSLHSGLPISVVDRDRARLPLAVRIADDVTYVFNASGQVIDVAGLLCLHDADGPCANAVKDSQRTKTHGETRRVLVLVWGLASQPERTMRATAWYRELLERLGATTRDVPTT
jgi:DNA/RNA-binding domain of Phe-tRNA-synthetase-like protein